jgi:hypothetical protein
MTRSKAAQGVTLHFSSAQMIINIVIQQISNHYRSKQWEKDFCEEKEEKTKENAEKRVVCIFVDKYASRPCRSSSITYPMSESIKRGE